MMRLWNRNRWGQAAGDRFEDYSKDVNQTSRAGLPVTVSLPSPARTQSTIGNQRLLNHLPMQTVNLAPISRKGFSMRTVSTTCP